MTPSKYQVAIYKEYDETNNNIIIQAGAGSGKSSTILELLKRTPKFKKTILTAFNKSIKDELENRVSPNVKVSTIHALGFSILRENKPRNYKVSDWKTFNIAKGVLDLRKMKEKEKWAYLHSISKIIDLVRLNLAYTRSEIEQVCNEYNISIVNNEIDDTLDVLQEIDKYNTGYHKQFLIDFVDMLWLPCTQVPASKFPKYAVVFTDELQDLNPLQKFIIESVIHEKGRFIGVGDDRQAIYSFMGANVQSFESFKNRPNTKVLPLSVTYRCARKITEFANTIFEGLESFEGLEEGIVRNGSLNEAQEGDFVLCRNNLPLIESWISFIRAGKKCSILGKDYGEALIAVLNKLSKYDDYKSGVNDLLEKKEAELKKLGIANPKTSSGYQNLVEKLEIVNVLKKEFGSFEMTKSKVETIFSDTDKTGIRLMTIHKSKGLEAKRVFVLGYNELLPSKYAASPLEMYQEQCLKYVAVTRAKLELVFVKWIKS